MFSGELQHQRREAMSVKITRVFGSIRCHRAAKLHDVRNEKDHSAKLLAGFSANKSEEQTTKIILHTYS